MKEVLILVLITCNFSLLGQQSEGLEINLEKPVADSDSCCVYNIAIKNKSDSIVCILHSMFISLTSSMPQGVAVYQQTRSKQYFSLHYSFKDTLYDFQSLPYRGECILPKQVLSFRIRVSGSDTKEKHLSFEYIYLPDISYRKFMNEMQNVGLWYHKYKRTEKSILLQ